MGLLKFSLQAFALVSLVKKHSNSTFHVPFSVKEMTINIKVHDEKCLLLLFPELTFSYVASLAKLRKLISTSWVSFAVTNIFGESSSSTAKHIINSCENTSIRIHSDLQGPLRQKNLVEIFCLSGPRRSLCTAQHIIKSCENTSIRTRTL